MTKIYCSFFFSFFLFFMISQDLKASDQKLFQKKSSATQEPNKSPKKSPFLLAAKSIGSLFGLLFVVYYSTLRNSEESNEESEKLDLSVYEKDSKVLDLSNKNITKLPEELKQFTSLKKLVLSNNPLKTINQVFFQGFNNLEELHLENCDLETFPLFLSFIPTDHMKHINLKKNRLGTVIKKNKENFISLFESFEFREQRVNLHLDGNNLDMAFIPSLITALQHFHVTLSI